MASPRLLCRLPSLFSPPAWSSSLNFNGTSISSYTLPKRHHGILRQVQARPLTSTAPSLAKQLPPRRVILDSEIEENFLKGSGPGGQKINKTSSAVQLKHLETGIVVKCQESRSRSYNRKVARKLLGERLEELEFGEQSRTAVKARERSKKKASADKKKRRKYRALSEGQDGEIEGKVGVEVEEARALEEGEIEDKEQLGGSTTVVDTEPRKGSRGRAKG